MHAEFIVRQCLQGSGSELVISGEVKKGLIAEGANGLTSRGKRFAVIKIESRNERKRMISENERASLYIKYITLSDINAGELVTFR